MKDLYHQLKIDSKVEDPAVIRLAIGSCRDRDLAQSAQHVLLNQQRKLFYDQHHQLLTTIGQLRERLSIPRSDAWEELGNQDFDHYDPAQFDKLRLLKQGGIDELSAFQDDGQGAFGDMSDVLDDLASDIDPQPVSPVASAARRYPRKRSGPFNPAMMIFAGGILAGVCFLVLVLSSLGTSDVSLPSHGFVLESSVPTGAKKVELKLQNPGPGHACVDFISRDDQQRVLSVFVQESPDVTSVMIPRGRYEIRFAIGTADDWDGNAFRRSLREAKTLSKEIKNRATLVIPSDQ